MTGQIFNQLTIIEDTGRKSSKMIIYKCLCACGNVVDVRIDNLKSGHTKACGCMNQTHSHCKDGKLSPTYTSWAMMKQRCLNSKNPNFKYYGERGIIICERWMVFKNFLADMGIRPKATSIDRIDVNGNYELSNCRWADSATQSKNRRCNYEV